MADYVNPNTKELVPSVSSMPSPWIICTRTEFDAWSAILLQYRKWVTDHIEEMTAPEKAVVDAAIDAANAQAKEDDFTNRWPGLTKGTLAVHDGTKVKKLELGSSLDGETLVVDSASPVGIAWKRRLLPVMKQSDQIKTADTNFADDTVLKFPVLANHDYIFRGTIFFDTTAAADFKWRIQGPASPTGVRLYRASILPGATAFSNIGIDTALAVASALAGTGTNGGWCEFNGVLRNGNNAGNISFQWAQNTSDAGNTIVRAGSFIEYARLD